MTYLIRTAVAASLMLSLWSCGSKEHTSNNPIVEAIEVTSGDSLEIEEVFSASIKGQQDIEIFPQISGKISSVNVKEGQSVSKGTVLFVIDQIPFRAALNTALANVHAAEARVRTAELEKESQEVLFKENVISQFDLSTAINALAVAEAELEQAKAEELNARNNLSYTEIKSPVDGMVGTLPLREGALVSPSMTSPLTTVSDNRNMFVYFSMTENQLRSIVKEYGSLDAMIKKMPSVHLRLNDGDIYTETGRIETISGVLNPQTGTVSIRSIFPNPDNLLWSGGVGNIIVPHNESNVMVIPKSATYELQDKVYVYRIVDNKTVATEVKVSPVSNSHDFVVKSGLQQGDMIVAKGAGLLKNGTTVEVR